MTIAYVRACVPRFLLLIFLLYSSLGSSPCPIAHKHADARYHMACVCLSLLHSFNSHTCFTFNLLGHVRSFVGSVVLCPRASSKTFFIFFTIDHSHCSFFSFPAFHVSLITIITLTPVVLRYSSTFFRVLVVCSPLGCFSCPPFLLFTSLHLLALPCEHKRRTFFPFTNNIPVYTYLSLSSI